ncbi:MAG: TetR/AcrR family transcriptional regulator [Lachnospiraceae bacterium]|nr:TetR/AcrR family transcriptional regulator [Lachnospiraceae bacterium]
MFSAKKQCYNPYDVSSTHTFLFMEVPQKMMNSYLEYISGPTDRRLTIALISLLENQSLDEVSIKDILRESGVSRSTFYRRYRDKYDLLNKNYQCLLDNTINRIATGFSYKKAFFSLYEALREYPAFFRNALSSNDPNGLKEYIYRESYRMYSELLSMEGFDMKSAYNELLLTGYLRGALEVTCEWAASGMDQSLEMLFEISYELIPHQIQRCLAVHYM